MPLTSFEIASHAPYAGGQRFGTVIGACYDIDCGEAAIAAFFRQDILDWEALVLQYSKGLLQMIQFEHSGLKLCDGMRRREWLRTAQ